MTTLADYEFQVSDLLHDPSNTKWSLTQIDAYINEARRQLVMDTGCLRSLQQSYVTQGVEQYTFGQVTGGVIIAGGSGYTAPTVAFAGGGGTGVAATLSTSGGAVNTITFSNNGSGYSSVPSATLSDPTGTGAVLAFGVLNVNTYDVLNVSIYIGNQRYALNWYPFRQFSSWYRPYIANQFERQPVAWAAYGDTSIFLAPSPDQSYAMEVDTIILPTALLDRVTADPIPPINQDPIKFYAARLAKNNSQSFGEAETFMGQYRQKLLECTSVYTGRIPDPYGSPP